VDATVRETTGNSSSHCPPPADGKVNRVSHKPEDLPESSPFLLTAFGRKAKKLTAMIRKHWAFLLLPVTGSVPAFAQNDSTGKQLDQVVVTATKYPIKQSQTGKVVIVIPHEAID
jgi:hypothetical protein